MTTSAYRIDLQTCARIMRDALDRVIETQQPNVKAAALLCTTALRQGGILQAFGTGHSRSFTMEICGRAGGLVPANALAIKDLVMYGHEPPETILDPTCERDPDLARRVLDLAQIQPHDVFVIASNSGGNGSVVELARLVKERGHRIVAVTSLAHSKSIVSRHASGLKLYELADVVIDNGGVAGDATLPLPTGGAIAPTSSLTAVLIAQLLVAEICRLLLAADEDVPVLISANVPGGDEHNEALLQRFGARVRLSEP